MTTATRRFKPAGPGPARPATAYDDDLYGWAMEQAAALRAGAFSAIDRENLAEEIETLGRSQLSSLVSAWRVVLLHMLKFDHQPDRRSRSWALSIRDQRDQAADVLADSPGLKRRLDEAMVRAYRGARLDAARETDLPLRVFPEECPYSRDEMLTRDFPIDPRT
ncbi:DUF29 domain-containing protein [Methylobacterium indicum]|uniref:DUF29 domain-containing protein n=1 Tax=Methylobacterium indicum TaxID=1775910 RepID=A0ABR5HCT3_9HYPH|nr:DUF29 domain-containing protein [Methylobacterium indicum]KMO14457.1 hypothetical protein QR78_23375 [Methylobacterium indicum]KMO23391.1 hypothetical protein QR79_13510 [Methylobacterium indicum]